MINYYRWLFLLIPWSKHPGRWLHFLICLGWRLNISWFRSWLHISWLSWGTNLIHLLSCLRAKTLLYSLGLCLGCWLPGRFCYGFLLLNWSGGWRRSWLRGLHPTSSSWPSRTALSPTNHHSQIWTNCLGWLGVLFLIFRIILFVICYSFIFFNDFDLTCWSEFSVSDSSTPNTVYNSNLQALDNPCTGTM